MNVLEEDACPAHWLPYCQCGKCHECDPESFSESACCVPPERPSQLADVNREILNLCRSAQAQHDSATSAVGVREQTLYSQYQLMMRTDPELLQYREKAKREEEALREMVSLAFPAATIVESGGHFWVVKKSRESGLVAYRVGKTMAKGTYNLGFGSITRICPLSEIPDKALRQNAGKLIARIRLNLLSRSQGG